MIDITGRRERAVKEYNQAIWTKDNTQGVHEREAKYFEEPYQWPARQQLTAAS